MSEEITTPVLEEKKAEAGSTLTVSGFATAAKRAQEVVKVLLPSVSVAVYVKKLADEQAKNLFPTKDEKDSPEVHLGRVLSATMCYHDGSQIFDEKATATIMAASHNDLSSAYMIACRLNKVPEMKQVANIE